MYESKRRGGNGEERQVEGSRRRVESKEAKMITVDDRDAGFEWNEGWEERKRRGKTGLRM